MKGQKVRTAVQVVASTKAKLEVITDRFKKEARQGRITEEDEMMMIIIEYYD